MWRQGVNTYPTPHPHPCMSLLQEKFCCASEAVCSAAHTTEVTRSCWGSLLLLTHVYCILFFSSCDSFLPLLSTFTTHAYSLSASREEAKQDIKREAVSVYPRPQVLLPQRGRELDVIASSSCGSMESLKDVTHVLLKD